MLDSQKTLDILASPGTVKISRKIELIENFEMKIWKKVDVVKVLFRVFGVQLRTNLVATNSDEYFSTLGERKNNSQRSKKVLRFDEERPAGFLRFCRDLWFAGSEKENYS